MKDYIVRATAGEWTDPCICCSDNQIWWKRQERDHDTSPVATAALGRLLTAGAMMGGMMKNETDMLTLQIKVMDRLAELR